MTDELRRDLIAGLIILGFGLLAIFVLIPKGIDEPQSVEFAALSPSYWPRIICVILAIFGAAITGRTLLALGSGTDTVPADEMPEERTPIGTLAILLVMLALYFAVEPLGIPLSSAIALFGLMLLAGERRPHILLAVSIGLPLALYYFFVKAASIPIPTGFTEPYFEAVESFFKFLITGNFGGKS